MKLKIVKATGLAPVLFLEGKEQFMKGSIAGLSPLEAAAAIKDGYGTQDFEVPDDVELVDHEPSGSEADPAPSDETDETDWRKMKFLSQYGLAVGLGYEGEKKGEPVRAFLEEIDAKQASV